MVTTCAQHEQPFRLPNEPGERLPGVSSQGLLHPRLRTMQPFGLTHCRYDLRGLPVRVCPECGAAAPGTFAAGDTGGG